MVRKITNIDNKKVDCMYNGKIYLTPQEILDKDFKIDARGYRPQEVDKFLDMIIRDYTEFISIIKNQEKEINNLNHEKSDLKSEIRRLRSNIEAAEDSVASGFKSVNNVDLLRRLSQLEKVVFGKNE